MAVKGVDAARKGCAPGGAGINAIAECHREVTRVPEPERLSFRIGIRGFGEIGE